MRVVSSAKKPVMESAVLTTFARLAVLVVLLNLLTPALAGRTEQSRGQGRWVEPFVGQEQKPGLVGSSHQPT